jgi:hypothetical protein
MALASNRLIMPDEWRRALDAGAPTVSRAAADILGVAVPFFFEGGDAWPYKADEKALSPSYTDDFVANPDGLRLAKAFMRIARPAVRRSIVTMVQEVAGEDGQ